MIQEADPNPLIEDESSLAARAAWLHHIGRLTQNDVAARLNLPTGKAHRLIARAGREGMVRVFVDGAIARCMQTELSRRLASLSYTELKVGKLVAVAGGTARREAFSAVLSSGLLHGLLTDERTAADLVGPRPEPWDLSARF